MPGPLLKRENLHFAAGKGDLDHAGRAGAISSTAARFSEERENTNKLQSHRLQAVPEAYSFRSLTPFLGPFYGLAVRMSKLGLAASNSGHSPLRGHFPSTSSGQGLRRDGHPQKSREARSRKTPQPLQEASALVARLT